MKIYYAIGVVVWIPSEVQAAIRVLDLVLDYVRLTSSFKNSLQPFK